MVSGNRRRDSMTRLCRVAKPDKKFRLRYVPHNTIVSAVGRTHVETPKQHTITKKERGIMADREQVRQQMSEDGVEYILAQFVDINGSPKVKMVPVAHFDDIIDEGAGFAGAAVWGMGQGPHSHDMLGRIDLDSYSICPWTEGVARFASDLHVDDEPHPYDPRVNLKRVLDDAREQGYVFYTGIEPEHFLVTRNPDGTISIFDPDNIDTLDKPCYDFKGIANVQSYLRDMMDGMARLGWDPYQSDHEDANGQYELNFVYSDALTTADRYTFFKMMSSQFAIRYGAIATHMAKPFSDRTGSGGHVHYHVADAATGENIFLDEGDDQGLGLSEFGVPLHRWHTRARTRPLRRYLAHRQLLQTTPGRAQASTSARSGFTWTPAFVTYGDNNRTQMIRTAGPGHLEDRTVSAANNPYLAFAAYLDRGSRRRAKPARPRQGKPRQQHV